MRKGIADLHRRAEVSQKASEKYLNALASVDDITSLREIGGPSEKPVSRTGKRVRALHPFNDQDQLLLEAISRGEFLINGLTSNRCFTPRQRDLTRKADDDPALSAASFASCGRTASFAKFPGAIVTI